jgi:hypothetical protein
LPDCPRSNRMLMILCEFFSTQIGNFAWLLGVKVTTSLAEVCLLSRGADCLDQVRSSDCWKRIASTSACPPATNALPSIK